MFYLRKRLVFAPAPVVHSVRSHGTPDAFRNRHKRRKRRELPDAVIRAQLETILASEVFSRSQQLRRFLSFIVEQRLAGQGHSLKESVLAHELYGKGTTSMAAPIRSFA